MRCRVRLADEAATRAHGARFIAAGLSSGLVFLEGELGAGKTTWVRGCLQALGVRGHVRSPTFTLVETYETGIGLVHHLDLYRLAHPDELEFLGVRDLFDQHALCFVEWPERGGLRGGDADLRVVLEYAGGDGRWASVIAQRREFRDLAATVAGVAI